MNYTGLLSAAFYQISKVNLVRRLFLFSVIASLIGLIIDITAGSGETKNWKLITFNFLMYPAFLAAFFFFLIIAGGALLMIIRKNHFKNVIYSFNNWGMEKNGKGIAFSRPWNRFLKYEESKHFFFLYITSTDAHIIQKKMFENVDELKDFRQLIQEKLNAYS